MEPTLYPETLLLVTADADSAAVVREVLAAERFDLTVVATPADAEHALRGTLFDVVLLDFDLTDLLEQAGTLQPEADVVVMASRDRLEAALRAGAPSCLLKPLRAPQLRNLLRQIKERRSTREKLRVLELRLAQQNRELRQANEMLTHQMAMTAHDIRSPLNAIMGNAHMLLHKTLPAEKARELLTDIQEIAVRLDSMVGTLLDVSRVEAGQLHLDVQPVEVRMVLEKALATARRHTRHEIVLDGELTLSVLADPVRTLQVLYNLIGNAIKYAPDGGRIEVRVSRKAAFVLIEVKDSGLGIANHELPKVFDRFFRSRDPRAASISGHGLGLFIVKTFVEMMGGRIWVTSVPGEGSTFSFTLPAA
ncbi:MAG: sensor histidine kinase [Candidatus Xenobia bacterium]